MKLKKLLPWIGALVVAGAIFYLSSQPALISSVESKTVLFDAMKVMRSIFRFDMKDSTMMAISDRFNEMARGCMHGAIYFVLGLLIYAAVRRKCKKSAYAILMSMVLCFSYGLLDEVHQLFVPGRAFQLSDLMMDFSGSLIGIALICLIQNVVSKRINR